MTENIEQIIADAIANGTPVKLRGGEKAYLKYDHSVFNLEGAKRGGIVKTDDNRFIQFTQAGYVGGDWGWFIDLSTKEMKTAILYSELDYDSELDEFHIDRMATPQECEDAGVEYIEPPIRWLQIDSAPEDGRIIEVADFRVVVANECPLSKHWKFWRDIPHPLNKNSMTQPPKGE